MTLEEKIASWLPSPRDPSLPECEYYCEDQYGKIQRGWITDIVPAANDVTYYRLVNKRGQIHSSYGTGYCEGWFEFSMLYDNKEDCRNHTHLWFDGWEEYRRQKSDE